MTNLPTGTVTFDFTGIEGSTRQLRKLGDLYATVLAEQALFDSIDANMSLPIGSCVSGL